MLSIDRSQLQAQAFRLKSRLANSSDDRAVPFDRVKVVLKGSRKGLRRQAQNAPALASISHLGTGRGHVIVRGVGGILYSHQHDLIELHGPGLVKEPLFLLLCILRKGIGVDEVLYRGLIHRTLELGHTIGKVRAAHPNQPIERAGD